MADVLVEKLADRLRVKREAPTAAARLSSVRGAKPRRLRCFSQWNSSEPERRKEGGTVGVGGKKRLQREEGGDRSSYVE